MLYEFYGRECPHCIKMAPLIDKLKEEGVGVKKFETWHNRENEETRKKYDQGFCGGVPFFINPDTKNWICGETSYEDLKNLATEKNKT